MMTAMPYNLQDKVVVDVSANISQISSSKWKNIERERGNNRFSTTGDGISRSKISACCSIDSEPTSILDTRRSPSSPTSSSTLSSFNGGGNKCAAAAAASAGNRAPVVALLENNSSQRPISLPELASGGSRKEACAAELQNVHYGSGITSGCSVAGCHGGGVGFDAGDVLGLEDFECLFQGGDESLGPWIVGEAEDFGGLGFKPPLSAGNPLDYEGCGMDEVAAGGISSEGSLMSTSISNSGFPGAEFLPSEKISPILQGPPSGSMDCKVSYSSTWLNPNSNPQSTFFAPLPNVSVPVSMPAGLVVHQSQLDVGHDKPQIYSPQLLINQQQAQRIQSSSLLMPPPAYCQLEQNVAQSQARRHGLGAALEPNMARIPFIDQSHEFLLRKHQQQLETQQQFTVSTGHPYKQMMVAKQKVTGMGNDMVQKHYQLQQHQQLQEHAAHGLLRKVVDLIQTGNFTNAQEILARLNHQLPVPAKPLMRVALCLKEALQSLLLMGNPVAVPPPKCLSPVDVVHKMSAYKVLSDVSPLMHFVNFTSTQAILEELEDAESIHIMDFDIGCGAKWASLVQELPLRKRRAGSLKITAFASFSTCHQLELALMHENLKQFANDLGIILDLQVVNFDSFDPSKSTMPNFGVSDNESVAVCFPVWASSPRPYLIQSLLRFIRHQSPKIMVSLDRGCDRCDMPLAQHLVHALDSCANLLESLDCANVPSNVMNKFEKFFVQPIIGSAMLGRIQMPDKIPPWKNILAASGFVPCSFSNLSETQADYIVKRSPGRGFRVDKREGSLVLSWRGRELVAASAWKC